MTVSARRVWRAAPLTLTLVWTFTVAAAVSIPALAYVIYSVQGEPWLPVLLGVLTVLTLLYAWRFGLHPLIRVTDQELVVRNPFRTFRFLWEDITVIAAGENGLVIGSEDGQAEAWCVQKSNYSAKRNRRTRADRIVDELLDLLELHDPPVTDAVAGWRIRRARPDESRLLTRMERAASEAAFGHVFPPEQYPYPVAEVARRWRRLLRDRLTRVHILEHLDEPAGFVAFNQTTMLHLGVVPEQGRRGFGSALAEYAVQEIFGRGTASASLWVLTDNQGARSLYSSLGWQQTADRRDCEFPPYPQEQRLTKPNPGRPTPEPADVSGSESWDNFATGRPLQGLWITLGVLALLPGLAATALRVLGPTDDGPAILASFTQYGVLAYLLSSAFLLVALARARRRAVLAVLTAGSVALLACHIYWVAPLFVSDHREARTPGFTLMVLNTEHGLADPQQVSAEAGRADMVVLLEATTALVAELRSAGWDDRFPYAAGVAVGVAGDTVLYSRYPLADSQQLPNSEYQSWQATAEVPQVGRVRVIAAHPCNPLCGSNLFRTEHQELQTAVEAGLGTPLIVAGDLNAVEDHAPMRDLRRVGMRSATDLLGAGWLPTYPANSRVPPLLPIDHVLLNQSLTATSIERFRVDGTDHLGLMVQIAGA